MEFYIDSKDWKKIIDYAQASYDEFQSEIGGFLVAKKNKEGWYKEKPKARSWITA